MESPHPAARRGVQPELSVRRGVEAIRFYVEAFGAVEVYRVGGTPDLPSVVAQLTVGDSAFWVSDEAPTLGNLSPEGVGATTVRLLLIVDDPEATVAIAVGLGATEDAPVVEEHGWALGRITDPFGHHWEVGRPVLAWPPPQGGPEHLHG